MNQKQIRANRTLVLTLVMGALGVGYCNADPLAGTWKSETIKQSQPGTTNRVEAFEVIHFLKDGTLEMSDVLLFNGGWHTNVSFKGTYTMASTNQVSLKLLAQNVPDPSHVPPLSLTCSVVKGELSIPELITSVAPEYKRYRKVK